MANLLESMGIESVVVDKTTFGLSFGISFTAKNPDDGWQVWVKDEKQIAKAIGFLEHREQEKKEIALRGPVNATCEECGAVTTFDGNQRGTVQNCPKCKRYMDVGGDE